MRTFCILLLATGLWAAAHAADGVSGKIIKVLPFFLDHEGQIAKSPSLYDRDAYQAELRENTNLVSGIRYDVQWSAKNAGNARLKIRIELRGTTSSNLPKFKTLEAEVKDGYFSTWTPLPLTGEAYHQFGAVTAWRATIWDGERLLGEQKSFLW
jgi:hypothetical protein